MLCFFSTIGGFLFGYNTSVIAGTNLYIEEDFEDVTDFQKELIVSLTLLGAAIGSLLSGTFADKFGRKPAIYLADLLFIAGSLIMAFCPSIDVLIAGRFIVGLGVGIVATVIPVYLAEISEPSIRGSIVNLNSMCICFGQVGAL